ncbi:MAG: radical SAM protein [Actinobacteria bacterium]|nr:MAG: radical SAM protein [Actinomycetota bacterium]
MIDFEALRRCYDEDRVYALQLEIWDRCEQRCDYCYMEAGSLPHRVLDSGKILEVLREASGLGVSRIEWLGGEPLLRPDWRRLLDASAELGIVNNMWTGGLPLARRGVAEDVVEATAGGMVAFHVGTIDEDVYVALHSRAHAGDLRRLLAGVENVLAAGKPPDLLLNSVTLTRGQSVSDMIRTIDFFKDTYGIDTCVNVYQSYRPMGTGGQSYLEEMPDRTDVGKVLQHAAARSGRTHAIANCVNKEYCSATVAVTNEGLVTPCATIRPADSPSIHERTLRQVLNEHVEDLLLLSMKRQENLAEGCRDCGRNSECWGCRGRAWDCFDNVRGRDPACFRNPVNR